MLAQNKNLLKIELATQEELEKEVTCLVNTLNLLNFVPPPLFWHAIPSLVNFYRLCHFAEDPIERTHASDKQLSQQFYNIRNPEKHKDSKRKVIFITRHPEVVKTSPILRIFLKETVAFVGNY